MKHFGAFRLDTVNQCLWCGEERLALTPKAFDLLRYLVEHPDRLVTQDEMLDALWTGTYVNSEVIKKYILEIRKVLGDQAAKPTFIATEPRRGYRFVAPVRDTGGPVVAGSTARIARSVVGRTRALARLQSGLDSALHGDRQMIFVTGEAGVGKTTLVDAFHQQTSGRPKLRIARGQCVEGFGGKEAYYPALEALGQLIRGRDGAAVLQVLAERAPTWLAQFPTHVKPEQRDALQAEILGTTRDRMVREICEAIEALATEGAFVLVLEDLHWVDLATLDLVSALARRRGSAKVVVIATYRPTDVDASSPLRSLKQDLLIHQLCDEIALAPLETADVADYLAAEFPASVLPAGLADLVHRRSGGNPLFMVAMVQDMVKKGQLVQHEEGWILAAPLADISLAVPDTLQQFLQGQIGQLARAEQRLLERACVAGEQFSVFAIAADSDSSAEDIENVCEELAARQQFIRPVGLLELSNGHVSAHYEFRHSLYRQAVYQTLSDVHRARLHRIIGNRLSVLCDPEHPELAGEVACHFEDGRDYARAIDYLMLSADNATRRFAYREATQALERALALVPKMRLSARTGLETQVRERIGDAHYWFGAMSDSADAYEAAITLATNAGLTQARVRVLSGLVRPLGLIDPDRGIAALQEAEQLSATLPDALSHAQIRLLAAGSRLMYDAWREEDWAICASARDAIHRLSNTGLPPYHRVIYGHLELLQGHYAEALRSLDAGIPTQKEPASLMAHFFALSGRTLALLLSGRFGELMHIIRAGAEMAKKNGTDPWLFSFREAWLRALVLDFDGAGKLCEVLTRPTRQHPLGQPRTIGRFSAGYMALAQGRYEVALRQFQDILEPRITPKFFLHWHWRLSARLGLTNVWLAAGDLAQAATEADRLLQSVSATAEPNLQALAWDVQARVAMAQADWTGAAEHIQTALAIVDAFEVPTIAWRVHATCADLHRHLNDDRAAEAHRARAESVIASLADSFAPDEPLRLSFLSAAEVRALQRAPAQRAGRSNGGSPLT